MENSAYRRYGGWKNEAHLGRMYEVSRKVSRLFASTSLFKRGRDLDK